MLPSREEADGGQTKYFYMLFRVVFMSHERDSSYPSSPVDVFSHAPILVKVHTRRYLYNIGRVILQKVNMHFISENVAKLLLYPRKQSLAFSFFILNNGT